MKKKILIHTLFYQNYNYGGILQAYALYSKLSSLGYDCEELNYDRNVTGKIKKIIYRGYRLWEIIREPIYYKKSKQRAAMQNCARKRYISEYNDELRKVFEVFMTSEFKTTKVFHPDDFNKIHGYDYYIAGGDQVWNPDWTDKNFFFYKLRDGKKIGYSCSAGKNKFTSSDRRKIVKYAKKMDAITVRENNFSKMLLDNNISNRVIADPVFLLNESEWNDFSNDKYDLPEHYLFAYLLGDDVQRREAIKKFAKLNNLKIVSIPHVFRYYIEEDEQFADIKIRDAGPKEFVALIRNADFVVTDSFHGTAFSIIFEKQFLNFSRFKADDKRSLNARLKNINEEYGLMERMVNINGLETVQINSLNKIDYNECRKITEKKRTDAFTFIDEALR